MNIKKIVILSVLTVMLLGCINTASAGWFDFMADPSGSIDGKLQDNSAEYKEMTKMSMNDAGDGWTYVECMDWNGTIIIDLTNATDQQKEIIKETIENNISNINMTFKYDTDSINVDDGPYDFNITMDDNTLTIDYKADCRFNTSLSSTGTLSVVSGQIIISGDTPITIDFKK